MGEWNQPKGGGCELQSANLEEQSQISKHFNNRQRMQDLELALLTSSLALVPYFLTLLHSSLLKWKFIFCAIIHICSLLFDFSQGYSCLLSQKRLWTSKLC